MTLNQNAELAAGDSFTQNQPASLFIELILRDRKQYGDSFLFFLKNEFLHSIKREYGFCQSIKKEDSFDFEFTEEEQRRFTELEKELLNEFSDDEKKAFEELEKELNEFLQSIKKESKFSDSIKKGSVVHATFLDNSYSFDFLRCRRLISPRMAETTNCPVLSFSSFTVSIASIISCGTLACIFCDFSFFVPVAITVSLTIWWSTAYMKNILLNYLMCSPLKIIVDYTLICSRSKNERSLKVLPTPKRLLTTTLIGVTLWLIYSIPKLTLNLHSLLVQAVIFWLISIRSSLSLLLPVTNKRHVLWPDLLLWYLFLVRRCVMHNLIDKTSLTSEELVEQCFALAYSLQVAEHAPVKESLSFILLEKLDILQSQISTEVNHV